MTIEEWLDKRIKDAREDCLNQDIETYEDGYAEGYKDALQLVRDRLPFLDHEVTLREASELCGDCSNCPYPVSPADPAGCYFDDVPGKWPVDEIQKRVKEKTNESQRH